MATRQAEKSKKVENNTHQLTGVFLEKLLDSTFFQNNKIKSNVITKYHFHVSS